MSRLTIIFNIIVQYYTLTKLIVFTENSDVLISIGNDTLANDYQNLNNTNILRYGHHRIQECGDFKKSYVCIMKCLELGYHIAQSDINCKCTCFKDYTKAKYFNNVTKGWRVPTTSLPPWAVVNSTNTIFMQSKEINNEYQDSGIITLNNKNCTDTNGAMNNIKSTVIAENLEIISSISDLEYRVSTVNPLGTVKTDANIADGDDNTIKDSTIRDHTEVDPSQKGLNEGPSSSKHPTEENPSEDYTETDPSEDHTETDPSEDHTETDPSEDHTETDPSEDHTETDPSKDPTEGDPSEDNIEEAPADIDPESTEAA